MPTYKRKEFTVLVRRGKKSEAGIMILSQSFVSWMEKVTTNPLELFFVVRSNARVCTKTMTMELVAQRLYCSGYKWFDSRL